MYGLARMKNGWLLFPCEVPAASTNRGGYMCVEVTDPTYAAALQKSHITLLFGRTLFNNLDVAQCVQQILNESMVDEHDYDLCSISIPSDDQRNEVLVIAVMYSGSYTEGRKWLQSQIEGAIEKDVSALDVLALTPEALITDCKQHGILAISSVA